ncbi:hypothetical protein B0T18DRAFT_413245 [Schizothecium vesticola]|uniref:Uncharacterized protein n=1 Tax=Schizothecium vesticola TaxID=314040 RepID=A0AA40EX45_9PEZI|nr:hypothetical protein B0T18DRAFT_413245 [Schizothecium vesticola]
MREEDIRGLQNLRKKCSSLCAVCTHLGSIFHTTEATSRRGSRVYTRGTGTPRSVRPRKEDSSLETVHRFPRATEGLPIL